MTRIDDKTWIPISWVACILVFVCGAAWAIAFWVFSVDNRLGNLANDVHLIKKYMNIPEIAQSSEPDNG